MLNPDNTLAAIRDTIQEATIQMSGLDLESTVASLVELVEYVTALDEWITTGGFLPIAWGR